jgi:hypothetical protein
MRKWKTITSFPQYEVSDDGMIRHRDTQRVRKPRSNNGYPCVTVKDGRRRVPLYCHRAVAEAFLGPCPGPGYLVAHRNGNRGNPCLGNLRWATYAENEADKKLHGTLDQPKGEAHYRAKLTEELIRKARTMIESGLSRRAVARQLGFSPGTIIKALNGTAWKHLMPV